MEQGKSQHWQAAPLQGGKRSLLIMDFLSIRMKENKQVRVGQRKAKALSPHARQLAFLLSMLGN